MTTKAPDEPPQKYIQNCQVCGLPYDGRPTFVKASPYFTHEDCQDWSTEVFPHDQKLKLARALAQHLKEAFLEVIGLCLELTAAQKKWPQEASQRLRSIEEAKQKAKSILSTIMVHHTRL